VGKPPLDAMINIFDFEAIAQRDMLSKGKKEGWCYYSSGGDDEITLRENHNAFHRLWLKPRIMVNVKEIDMRTTILGHPSSFPVYLSAVAMCGLGHPDGEVAWTKAAGAEEVIFMLPTLASTSFDDMTGARIEGQTLFFQLYVNPDREVAKEMVQNAEAKGCKALFITCDAPQLGNREKDRRNKVSKGAAVQTGGQAVKKKSEGVSKALTSFIDPSLCWKDVAWFKSITKMKIILKGVQTAEDAILAVEHGCQGIVLSNHGGRQLDSARSGIEVLPEVMEALREKGYDKKIEVFVDGGIRRGTDIFKAIALGATAVGIGRPALYAMASYGQEGIEKALQLLKSELQMTMRLCGTPTLADIKAEMVITDNLADHISVVPRDNLYLDTYLPHQAASYGDESTGAQQGANATTAAAAADDTDPDMLSVFVKLLGAVALAVVKTIFVPNTRDALNRTAIFLIIFLIVHMLGNLAVFISADAFNSYGYLLNKNPLLKFVEYYLLLAAVIHVVAGTYVTIKFKKYAKSNTNKLMLTGIVITAFIALHLWQFKFGKEYTVTGAAGGPLAGVEMRDLYKLELEVFSDPKQVAWYTAAVGMLGLHLWLGWSKTIYKMGLPKAYVKPADWIGHALLAPLTIGFISTPIYVYYLSQQAAGGAGRGEL
jgi:L-lactate dehydrogenase (cytochrome)